MPLGAHAAGAKMIQGRGQVVQERLSLVNIDAGGQQPDAAVDVIADRPGRNHALRVAAGGYTPDREAVALVHIRHHHHMPTSPGRVAEFTACSRDWSSIMSSRRRRVANRRTGTHIPAVALRGSAFKLADLSQVLHADHIHACRPVGQAAPFLKSKPPLHCQTSNTTRARAPLPQPGPVNYGR